MNDMLQYKGYYASIHFSGSDKVFYGKIIGINDLVSFEGSSVRELERAFKEAVNDYLETCKQAGRDPDKTYKGSFNVRVPSSLHKEAALLAAVYNITLNDLVKKALILAIKYKDEVGRMHDDTAELEPA